jgi:hypothetical protein
VTEETFDTEADIIALIADEHARVCHLFAELEETELREEESRTSPAAIWAQLAALLLRYLQAAEEICYIPFLDGAPDEGPVIRNLRADRDDIRDAVADVSLRQAESAPWWLAIHAARAAADRHVDCVESCLLPRARQQLSAERRRALGRQWRQYMLASSC